MSRRAAIALALAVTLAASGAWAQPAGDVEAEHRRGQALFREHHDAEAREVFRALVERTREPRALARLAATEAALGDWVPAVEHLRAALDARDNPWVAANRAGADGGLEGDLRRYASHVGRLEVLSATPGAELWVGGARVATLPMRAPLPVLAGEVTFELRAPGHETALRHERVDGGVDALTRVSLALHPLPATEAPAGPATPPDVAPHIAPEAPPRSSPLRTMAVVALGAGAVGLATGVVGILLRNGHADAFNDDPRCGRMDDEVVGGANCQTESDAGRSFETVAAVGFVAGGALAVAGVVLLIAAPPTHGPVVGLTGGPGDVGVGLVGRF